VLVFFVLSGLVVALPVLRPGFSLLRYYPTRLLRLYLPVWGALALSAALIALVPRDPETMPAQSWVRDGQYPVVDLGRLLSEASLLRSSYDVDNVLWSLRWELIFSLLLPLFVTVGRLARRYALLLAAGAAALSALGRVLDADALVYLPVFLIGTLMAVRAEDLRDWARRTRRRRLWIALALVGAFLLIASWLGRPIVGTSGPANALLWGLAGAGAAMVVLLVLCWPGAGRLMESGPVQWLGRISFSLYLVHVPILGTAAYLVGAAAWPLALVIAIPASFVVAAAFHRWVEAPAHRLARRTGAAVERAVRRVRLLS
jgi:peptidoglycan/LPS O-acetylase OafA/YrhL